MAGGGIPRRLSTSSTTHMWYTHMRHTSSRVVCCCPLLCTRQTLSPSPPPHLRPRRLARPVRPPRCLLCPSYPTPLWAHPHRRRHRMRPSVLHPHCHHPRLRRPYRPIRLRRLPLSCPTLTPLSDRRHPHRRRMRSSASNPMSIGWQLPPPSLHRQLLAATPWTSHSGGRLPPSLVAGAPSPPTHASPRRGPAPTASLGSACRSSLLPPAFPRLTPSSSPWPSHAARLPTSAASPTSPSTAHRWWSIPMSIHPTSRWAISSPPPPLPFSTLASPPAISSSPLMATGTYLGLSRSSSPPSPRLLLALVLMRLSSSASPLSSPAGRHGHDASARLPAVWASSLGRLSPVSSSATLPFVSPLLLQPACRHRLLRPTLAALWSPPALSPPLTSGPSSLPPVVSAPSATPPHPLVSLAALSVVMLVLPSAGRAVSSSGPVPSIGILSSGRADSPSGSTFRAAIGCTGRASHRWLAPTLLTPPPATPPSPVPSALHHLRASLVL